MSRDRGLPFWLAYGTFALGYARARAGEPEAGQTNMHQGMAMCRNQGICAQVPLFMARQAEIETEMGYVDAAMAMVDDAIAASDRTSHHSFDAELHRARGDTLLLVKSPDRDAAQAAYMRAIDIARCQHTKTFELRAAMSMARLWRDQGKRDEARELLAPVYGWFSEGFDTRDLKEAKVLLEELAA
jgi:predicted ATPase